MLFRKLNFFLTVFSVVLLILLNNNFSTSAEPERSVQTNSTTTTNVGYIPPSPKKDPQQVTISASRGSSTKECATESDQIRLLSPSDHIPFTVSSHPSFLAYFPKQINGSLIFTIVAPQVSEPILEQRILASSRSGFITVEMPPLTHSLELNKEYILTLMVVCNEQRLSENSYLRTSFKRVELNQSQEQQFINSTTDLMRSEILAESGIWVDSLATIYKAYLKNPKEPNNSEFFWELLKQINFVIN